MTKILGIAGSPKAPSRSSALLQNLLNTLEGQGHQVDMIRVCELNAEELLYAQWDGASIKDALARVASADGILVATPIYKAAYTGILKAFLDLLPRKALEDKIVLPLATAGSPLHKLALDYALNPVLIELGATTIARSLYLTDSQLEYDSSETLTRIDAKAQERIDTATSGFLRLLDESLKSHDEFVNV